MELTKTTRIVTLMVAVFLSGVAVATSGVGSESFYEECDEAVGEHSGQKEEVTSASRQKTRKEVADSWTEQDEEKATVCEGPSAHDKKRVDEECDEPSKGSPQQSSGERPKRPIEASSPETPCGYS
jgi:hypothetical protein